MYSLCSFKYLGLAQLDGDLAGSQCLVSSGNRSLNILADTVSASKPVGQVNNAVLSTQLNNAGVAGQLAVQEALNACS